MNHPAGLPERIGSLFLQILLHYGRVRKDVQICCLYVVENLWHSLSWCRRHGIYIRPADLVLGYSRRQIFRKHKACFAAGLLYL